MLQRSFASASALALWLAASTASAQAVHGFGFGPVLAYGAERGGVALGWELSGHFGSQWPIARVALGGTYLLSPEEQEQKLFHYLAWEPWMVIGISLGVAFNERVEPRAHYGVWEGAIAALREQDHVLKGEGEMWAVSLALGWRGFGWEQQLYLVPKIWRVRAWNFSAFFS